MPEGLEIGKLIGYVELDDSGVAEGAKSVKERLTSLGKEGKGLGTLVGIGAGAAVAAGLAGAMELEPAKAKLTAQLGLTANESKRIGGVAGSLYSHAYGDSMEQVNEAIKSVVQNIDGMGKASSKDLEAISSKVIAVSQTFDLDLGETTRAVGQMMRTGMAKDATEGLDIITKGLQNGTNVAGDLLDTFDEYSTQFRKLGLDGTSALGLLSQGLKGGARDADVVADALKEFSIRSVDGSTKTAQGFEALGLSSSDMAHKFSQGGEVSKAALELTLERLRAIPDPVARSAAAVNLFGTQAEDLGAALYKLDPTTAVSALGKVSGAAQQVANTTGGTAVAQFQSFTRTLQTFAVSTVGDTVLPLVSKLGSTLVTVVTPPLKVLGSIVGEAAHLFGELPGPIQTTAVALGLVVALRGPLSSAFGSLKTVATDALETITTRAAAARTALAEGGLASGIGAAAGAGEKAALGGLGSLTSLLGGPLGIAIAGVTIALPLLTSLFHHHSDAASTDAAANQDLANAIKNANGAIDESVRKAAAKELQDKKLLTVTRDWNVSAADMVNAALGQKDALDRVRQGAEAVIAPLEAQRKAITGNTDADRLNKGLLDAQIDTNKTWLGQIEGMAKTTDSSTKATNELNAATTDAGKALQGTTQDAQQQTDALNALKSAMDRYSGNAISAAEAQIAVSDGLAKMTAAATAGARSFDMTTQSGRDSEKAALDQITAIQQLATATYQATGSSEQAKAAWDREVGALRDRLIHLGYNTGAVDALIGTYAKLPPSVWTQVGTNAPAVATELDTLIAKLTTINNGKYYVDVYTVQHANGTKGTVKGTGYNAAGNLWHFADGGSLHDPAAGRALTPMAAGVAAVVGADTWRVVGDRPVGDEFYLPDDDAARTMALGAEWARRRGLALVPVHRYADGGAYGQTAAPSSSTTSASSATSSPAPVLFTGPVNLRHQRDAVRLAEEIDWRRRMRGRRR